jgi:hypothetical protein
MKQAIVESLLASDVNDNGLSEADLYDLGREQMGKSSADGISRIFQADYDGNGIVSKTEFEKSVERQRLRQVRQFEAARARDPSRQVPTNAFQDTVLRAQTLFRNADQDRDDNITLLEAYSAVRDAGETREYTVGLKRNSVFALDFNQDGLVTRQEVEAGIDRFVKEAKEAGVTFPEQGDRGIVRPLSGTMSHSTDQSLAQNCNLPQPSTAASIIRLSAYQGKQLADVSMAGQDVETTTSEVRIEPGSQPLYIIASTYEAQIWRFTGAVNRVERVVLSAWQSNAYGQPSVGLTGIPSDKLVAVAANCIGGFYDNLNQRALVATVGRRPDVQATEYGLAGIALPSMAAFSFPPQRPRSLVGDRPGVESAWQDLIRYLSGGVYSFEPAEIVSKSKFERYQVLPHQAGMTQLLIAGAIEPVDGAFIVRKAFRFPGAMHGGHSAKFIVPQGVPVPSGPRSHNCVLADGQTPVGAICSSPAAPRPAPALPRL